VTDHGYSVEVRIPLRVLRFDVVPVAEWGFQVRRAIDARQETDDWAFFPRSAAGMVSNFGRLAGLEGLRPGRRLELRPFVLGRVRRRDADDAARLAHGTDAAVSAGLDGKLQLTPELTLDLAVNPDFGQVEADTLVLNLSNYETFFPEKRPFFLEGIDTFSTMRTLVYTRRIGAQAGAPAVGRYEALVDVPDPAPIWGAAKVSGTLGGGTTLGLISTVTGESRAAVQIRDPGPGPTRRELRLVAPLTTFNVLRLRQAVGGASHVGALFTATNRFEPDDATGAFNDAYTGSVDGRWRSTSGDYLVAAQAVGSLLERGPARAQADGLAIHPGTLSPGATLWVTRQGGPHWLWSVWQNVSGRELELNDVGYLERKNDYAVNGDLTYRTIQPWGRTVETRTTLSLQHRETLEGLPLWNAAVLGSWGMLSNFWSYYVELHYQGRYFDDREVGDGAALERAARTGVLGALQSDPRRRVVVWMLGLAQRITNGEHFEARATITVRVLPQLDLELLPALVYQSGEPRYVPPPAGSDPTGGTYTFGRQRARNLGATLRASYSFTPELTLQAYAQLFLLAEHDSDFSTFTTAAARPTVHLSDLAPGAPTPAQSPDVQQATLNVNLVLRWEYRLGSTLFLVYTRAQSPSLTVSPGGDARLDVRPVLDGRASVDVVMLKLAYWWG